MGHGDEMIFPGELKDSYTMVSLFGLLKGRHSDNDSESDSESEGLG